MPLQVRTVGPTPAGMAVLALSGDLDYDTEQILGDAAGQALEDGYRRLILVCAEVTFCDSRGLNQLLLLRQDAERRGAGLVLAAISAPVRHVLDLTEALSVFALADTVEEAVRRPGETGADTPGRGIPSV